MNDHKHYCADGSHFTATAPLATRKVWLGFEPDEQGDDDWTPLCTKHANEELKISPSIRVEKFRQPGVA